MLGLSPIPFASITRQSLCRGALTLMGACLLVAGGCSSDGEKKSDGASASSGTKTSGIGNAGAKRIPADEFDASCCQKRDLDLNGDAEPDAYQWFKMEDNGNRIVVMRKEVDVNFDGIIDLIRNFDDRGQLASERVDADFDGKIDFVNFFEKGVIVRKEYDTNFDAAVDVVRYYEQGQLTRSEKDLDHDGKVDYWEYYEGGQIDRSGIDRDGDGEVDEWETVARE